MNRNIATVVVCLAILASPSAAATEYPIGPGAPTDAVAAAGPGAGAITLTWGAAESVSGVTAYHVYVVADDGNRSLVANVTGNATTFTETGLGNGVTRAYVVTAVDLLGEGPASEPTSATTFTAPDAPADVHAAPGALGTIGDVVVAWSAPPSDGGLPVLAYHVYRDGERVATVPADVVEWTDAGRELAREHIYAVSAANEAGEGARSDGACAMASPWGVVPGTGGCLDGGH